MKPRHRFRPSESWVLEERIALSKAAVPAEVAAAATTPRAMQIVFNGNFVTVPPQGLGGSDNLSLAGQARVMRSTLVRVVGELRSNASVAPPFSGISGGLILSTPRQQGTAILTVSGPAGDLSPTRRATIPLTFRVVHATGAFDRFANDHGVATLTLRSRPAGGPGGLVSGRFSLKLVDA